MYLGIFGLGHLYGIQKLWNEPFKIEMLYSHNRGFQQIVDLWGRLYVPDIERRIKELEEKQNATT